MGRKVACFDNARQTFNKLGVRLNKVARSKPSCSTRDPGWKPENDENANQLVNFIAREEDIAGYRHSDHAFIRKLYAANNLKLL